MINSLFKKLSRIKQNARQVIGMNMRNLEYIYPNNARKDFPIADHKLYTKEVLRDSDVPLPKTLLNYSSFYELRNLEEELSKYNEFVIKPSHGAGGGGIIVVVDRNEAGWISAGGKQYSLEQIKTHITDIIFGVFSFGLSDTAIIEERLIQHKEFSELSPFGLADIRLIVHHHQPVLCMSRIPTKKSDGRANLHQGAIGLGIDIESGITTHAILEDDSITHHPDTNVQLIGKQIPFWPRIVEISQNAATAVPLKYLGVDIAIAEHSPMLLEINVRPGLQIQNANMTGMRSLLSGGRE